MTISSLLSWAADFADVCVCVCVYNIYRYLDIYVNSHPRGYVFIDLERRGGSEREREWERERERESSISCFLYSQPRSMPWGAWNLHPWVRGVKLQPAEPPSQGFDACFSRSWILSEGACQDPNSMCDKLQVTGNWHCITKMLLG